MTNAAHILIADDDADFVMLLNAAFEEAHAENPIQVVADSTRAQKYLRNEAPYEDRVTHPVPGLIILDLRLPPNDAISLLPWIRQQPHLDGLPVVILTGSEFPNQEEAALHAGANGYFIKPFQFSKLVALAQHFRDTWLRHDEAPAHQSKR
jgi:CheY-like chemotaxis protein